MGQLDNKVAVVTGSSRGIGRAIAERYAAEGARVVISGRTAADLEQVLERITAAGGVPAHSVIAGAMDPDSARQPVVEAIQRFGKVDILVNNVGGIVGETSDPYTMTDEAFTDTLQFSLISGWWSTQAALPSMRDQGYGRVIFIGSGASVDFELIGQAEGSSAQEAHDKYAAHVLQNRVVEPEELTGMAVLLASPESCAITGQVISVDGGYKV